MRIIFTVTNDLTYDQRMHRICGSLAANGHQVMLLGRALQQSIPLEIKPLEQKRLSCFFHKGFAFYAEYNLRLFWYLLFARFDAVCSIDLDSLPAGCLATVIRRKKRVFDAHEYFSEVPELVQRPFVKFFWEFVARMCLSIYKHAYTVGPALADIFEKKYSLKFGVVRNIPRRYSKPDKKVDFPQLKYNKKILLYQGALNKGRGIETLLESIKYLENVQLVLAGEGDLSQVLRQKAKDWDLLDRVVFLGNVKPEDLKILTEQAWLGLNLLENCGLSYYYSLANKFFDYVQVGVPVLTMDFPEYRALNAQHEVAILLTGLEPEMVVEKVHSLMNRDELYKKLSNNCLIAREDWNWEREEQTLLAFWKEVAST
ncbi:MAG: glycosyltransferase [Saprospiraceae bacterium]